MQGYGGSVDEQTLSTRIQLQQAQNLDDYYKIFLNLASRIDREQTRLVVVDNILAVCDNFIKADGQVDFIERSNFILKHTKQLKRIAHANNIVVVVLNNVVADMAQNKNGFFGSTNRGQTIVPALGLLWSNCINERIGLKKKQQGTDVRRTISIEKSAFMRRADLEFEIISQGLRGKQ